MEPNYYKLMKILKKKGAKVNYSDPHVPIFPKEHKLNFKLSSVKLTSQSIRSYDLIIIATNHEKFNYSMVQKNAKIIIDTRGIYSKQFKNVIKA